MSATAYLPTTQDESPRPYTTIEVRAAGPAADLIPGVKAVVEQFNRDIAIDFHLLATQVAESLNRERLLATLSGFFGLMALLLAVIGLYGVMSYSMARRRAEIGIRMALGAAQQKVIAMVLREVSLLVGAGLALGLGAALLATRLIESFLFGLTSRDPVTLALAAGVLATVALVAGYVPARRASRVDPMVALREE
jgi:ABC-type antimicrobial peptide transport system permease subunit